MVSTSDTYRPDEEDTVTLPRPTGSLRRSPPPASGPEGPVTIYYLAWRLNPSHPWRSEEFYNRFDAHCEYFARIQRGLEVYLEVRRRPVG